MTFYRRQVHDWKTWEPDEGTPIQMTGGLFGRGTFIRIDGCGLAYDNSAWEWSLSMFSDSFCPVTTARCPHTTILLPFSCVFADK